MKTKRFRNLLIYGLVIAAIAIAPTFTNLFPLPSWATANQEQETTTRPRRLAITVKVSEPDDLKVTEGGTDNQR